MHRILKLCALVACVASATAGCSGSHGDINKVKHVVVIYMENHSFDNLYGMFPAADGIANAAARPKQADLSGNVYVNLPFASSFTPATSPIPNSPYLVEMAVPNVYSPGATIPDLVHGFYQEQAQIHDGSNDRYVAISDSRGLSLAHYDTTKLPMYPIAQQYTVADRFHAAAFGGSYLNHQWLIAAQTPAWIGTNPTPGVAPNTFNKTSYDKTQTCLQGASGCTTPIVVDGQFITDASGTTCYPVNTVQPVNTPHAGGSSAVAANLVPGFTSRNVGDLLNAAGVDWVWYSGGWNNALMGTPDATFQFHHQPFNYYANLADNSAAKATHLKDETDFTASLAAGTVPPVSFIKFLGSNNEHPGYADLITGDQHLADTVNAIKGSSIWKDTVIIITYDEFGGFADHVAPPTAATAGAKADQWGPGTRVPAIFISPFSKKGKVDHTLYDTTSILAFIEKRFGLPALSTRDAAADPLSGAFDFTQNP